MRWLLLDLARLSRLERLLAVVVGLLVGLNGFGCSGTPVVKTDALDERLLNPSRLPGALLQAGEGEERRIVLDTGWLGDVDPAKALTFAAYRFNPASVAHGVVARCDPSADVLVLRLLGSSETPISVLADADRRAHYRRWVAWYQRDPAAASAGAVLIQASLRQALAEKRLAAPLPTPAHVFAVAANFPSHLSEDLAIGAPDLIQALSRTRPRVFQKYPPVPPPDAGMSAVRFRGIIGPFDDIAYPSMIEVPALDEKGQRVKVPTHLDYEAEIGAVIGRKLTWSSIQHATDEALRAAVAAYVLVSDAKARNPQVVDRIVNRHRDPSAVPSPYMTGDAAIDRRLGAWDPTTCHWWSYAAGWGDYAAMGPFLVAAPASGALPPRTLLGGRSYADSTTRGWPVPEGHRPQILYLRQLTLVTEDRQMPDHVLWTLPQIIRAILAPDSALRFAPEPLTLMPGDVICLGTPGGVVITAKPAALVAAADALLFWWDALDWHDRFFAGSQNLYLNPGDTVFHWAEGLGFQHLPVTRLPE